MFFKSKKVVTVVLAFAMLFSITSPALFGPNASAAKKKTYGMIKIQTDFLDEYWPIAHKICEKSTTKKGRGDSDYELLAQVGLESGHLTSPLSRNKNNCLGIDAFSTGSESAYEHARYFDSIEECMECHADLMVRRYKEASRHHDDPYTFVDCIASVYAPKAKNYPGEIKSLISKYALYISQYYTPKLKKYDKILANAAEMLADTKKHYEEALKEEPSLENRFDLNWTKAAKAPLFSGDGSVFNAKVISLKKRMHNIKNNMSGWEAKFKKIKKQAHTTLHTIALGINYGYISASKENLGGAYKYVMKEYEKLN